jgi:hypothetical protein
VSKADVVNLNEPLLEVNLVDHSKRHLRPDFDDDIYLEPYMPEEDEFFEGFESGMLMFECLVLRCNQQNCIDS